LILFQLKTVLKTKKTMPWMQLNTVIGVFQHIPRNDFPTLDPARKKLTLEDCQKVSYRWDQIIHRHPALLPRYRIENLVISTVSLTNEAHS
jgi:hypothetical protein